MLKTMLVLITLFTVAKTADAACPERPVPLCQIVADNAVVVRAKVVSTQRVADDDDPDGVAAWIYHLDVIRNYRSGKPRQLAIMSPNTTARVILETAKEYIVFASRNSEGQLETGNYCDPYTDKEFDKKMEEEVVACLAKNIRPKK